MSKRFHSGDIVPAPETGPAPATALMPVTGAAALHAMFMRVAFAQNAYAALGLAFDEPFSKEDVDNAVARWRQLYDDESVRIAEHKLWEVAYETQSTVEDAEAWLIAKLTAVTHELLMMVAAALDEDSDADDAMDDSDADGGDTDFFVPARRGDADDA